MSSYNSRCQQALAPEHRVIFGQPAPVLKRQGRTGSAFTLPAFRAEPTRQASEVEPPKHRSNSVFKRKDRDRKRAAVRRLDLGIRDEDAVA